MGTTTKIQWAHHTWSPWRGCTKVSEGCRNCYAEALSKRNPKTMGVWGPNGHRSENADWTKPLRWNEAARKAGERRRVFPSLCDVFEDRADLINARIQFFDLVAATPHLDWLVLTKRPAFAREWLTGSSMMGLWPVPNVWLGTSVENQATADERIPELLSIPASVRWLSVEPLLGPIDLLSYVGTIRDRSITLPSWHRGILQRVVVPSRIGWVVIGGESGPHARPCELICIRELVSQCQVAGVPAFVKQLGSAPIVGGVPFGVEHPKGGDIDEFPADLQFREFPSPV